MQLTFEVPNTEAMKRKWLSHAAERWRGFKSSLTRRYVFGDRKDVSPCLEYQFLDEDTWQKFVESRNEPAFLVCLYFQVNAHLDCLQTISIVYNICCL